MKPSFFITLAALILVAWGSLFITVLDQSAKLTDLLKNDQHKFQVLKRNQNQLLCVTKQALNPNRSPDFINQCVRENQ